MTFNDYLCNAETGDVEAMLWLSHYYHNKNSFEGTEKSIFWSEKAAEAGDPRGIMITATGYPLLAMINEAPSVGAYETAILQRKKTIKWSKVALEQLELNQEGIDGFNQKIEEANYCIATSYYFLNKENDALDYTYGLTSINATILRGCCLFGLAKTNDEYYKAYTALKVLENNSKYYSTISSALHNEQRLFVHGIQFLASLYRIGIPEKISIDIDKSALLLFNAFAALNDDSLREQLQKDINHYRRKLFGGYKYVE